MTTIQTIAQSLPSRNDAEHFQTLLMELSTCFISIDAANIDQAIQRGQRHICEALGLDRSSLWQIEPDDPLQLELTHLYQRLSMPPTPKTASMRPLFPWFIEHLRAGKTMAICRLEDLPEAAAADRESLRRYGTHALVVIPFVDDERVHGALTFASASDREGWPENTLTWLKLIAGVFSNALKRAKSDQELRDSEKRLSDSLSEVRQLRDQLLEHNTFLRREVKQLAGPRRVVGESRSFQQIQALVEQVAPTSSTVLLLGETGTGKGVIAAKIHELSPRRAHHMVSVNCAAIPALLLESELFGREKGAYTGALSKQIGRFELAHGSTLFLDEIGELPIELQVKLLRAIEDHEIERLGSPNPVRVDVRIIAATNRDLLVAIRERTFRADLYYRLSPFPIEVPPLRERPDDIPLLVNAFVEEFSVTLGKRIESITEVSIGALQRYRWPGNVRELRNVVERAMILAKGTELMVMPPVEPTQVPVSAMAMKSMEREHIRRVLELASGRIRGKDGAAELLELKPTTLESRMAKLGISGRRARPTK